MTPYIFTELLFPAEPLASFWLLSNGYIGTTAAIAPGADIIISPFEKSMNFLTQQCVAINWLECSLYAATTAVMFVISKSQSEPEGL